MYRKSIRILLTISLALAWAGTPYGSEISVPEETITIDQSDQTDILISPDEAGPEQEIVISDSNEDTIIIQDSEEKEEKVIHDSNEISLPGENTEDGMIMAEESSVSAFSAVEGSVEEAVSDPEMTEGSTLDVYLPSESELFAQYADKNLGVDLFEETDPVSLLSSTENSGRFLTGINRKIYDYLKKEIEQIAGGSLSSTQIQVPVSALTDKFIYTGKELGQNIYDPVSKTRNAGFDFNKAVNTAFGTIDFSAIVKSLLYDCAYEFYWFDKTTGYMYGGPYAVSCGYDSASLADGGYVNFTGSYFVFCFYVSPHYSLWEGYTGTLTTDIKKTGATLDAVASAKNVVARYASYSDYDKLNAYKEWICNNVSYNYSSTSSSYTGGYGDPWQLIYVFDGDYTTNVVCEGYSKAFAYLCELSEFKSSKIRAYVVSGIMTTPSSGGGHMWNVVTMDDGQNYLVDITNCDGNSIGAPDKLFLVGTSGDIYDGYTFSLGKNVTFQYDLNTINSYYGGNILNLSATGYSQGISPASLAASAATPAPTATPTPTPTPKPTATPTPKPTATPTPKPAPGTASISKVSPAVNGLTISWGKVSTAGGYEIYRSKNGGSYSKIKTISSNSTVSYTDTGATANGAKYTYKIRTFKSGRYGAYSAAKTYYRLSRPPLSSASNSVSGKILVRYGKNTQASGYQIMWSQNSGYTGYSFKTISGNATLKYNISGLTKGKYYYIRMRSFKKTGSTVYYSAWTASKKVKVSR